VRQAFPGVPIVLGGIEASLRRIAHYDYWSDQVRRSVCSTARPTSWSSAWASGPIWEIAERLAAGEPSARSATSAAPPTCSARASGRPLEPSRYVRDGRPLAPQLREVAADRQGAFSEMSRAFQYETNPGNGRPSSSRTASEAVYFNPPALPLETADMDGLYDLPFTAQAHWIYGDARSPRSRPSSTRS
jgi:hypothetical protein